jgi:hypothetical protein
MICMHRALLALPILALTFTAACDAEESGSEFRAKPVPQMDTQIADIDIQIFAENGDGDGTVIWDIKEAGVHEGDPMEGAPLLLTLGPAGEIYDAMGVHTCTLAAPYLNKKIFQITGADGNEVLYTVYENWLLKGEVPPAQLTDGNIRRLLPTRLLFTFVANEVYIGDPSNGKILASATDDLTIQTQNHKLLIGALIEGECGSNGLPGYIPN